MNNKQMREELMKTFEKISNGEAVDAQMVSRQTNVAGKVIASATVELKYNQASGKGDREIEFLE